MAHLTIIRNTILALCTGLLFACGGGGGGQADITYTGKTGQAVLTAANDDAFGTTMLEGSSNSKSLNPFSGVAAGGGYAKKNLSLLQILAQQFNTDILDSSSAQDANSGVAAVTGNSLPGSCGGSLSISGGDTSGSVAYDNFCVGVLDGYNVTFNGSMSYTYAGTQTAYEITLKYSRFSITVETPTDSWTETGSGEMTIALDNGTLSVSYTSYFERDGKVYKIENLTLNNGVIQGRLYDPDYGYVDINTDLSFGLRNGEYCGGTLQINGVDANGQSVASTMTVLSDCSSYDIRYANGASDNVSWH